MKILTPDILIDEPVKRVINFNTLHIVNYCDSDFDLSATVNTSETITYSSSNTNVATIVNGKVHLTGCGTTAITATVGTYPNEMTAIQALIVNKASWTKPDSQTIHDYSKYAEKLRTQQP